MANQGYMKITGTTQGPISDGCSGRSSIGTKCQFAHEDEIMVLSFAHNMGNLQNSKHASHGPILITKNIDKSSPLLAQALASREPVDCTIDFYRASSEAGQEKFYTVKIKGGLIVDLSVDLPHSILQNDAQAQEHLAIRYRDITWTHHLAGTSGYAIWDDEK